MTRVRSTRRRILLLVNAVATALTLLTGLRENALVAMFTGRFGLVRARLRQAQISYAFAGASLDQVSLPELPALPYVADAYKFHRAPTRSPATTGVDRSTCLRVNSMNATALTVHFDDAFGKGPRREQAFVWSISPLYCDVINLQPTWVQQQCRATHGNNASVCDAFILAHFDQLKQDRSVQVGVPVDFGEVGDPYLKCKGLPAQTSFKYLTDHMVFQKFWAGGSYQVEFQTSVCWAVPLAFSTDQGLYRVQAADQQATVAVAVPVPHWSISVVSSIYSVVYLGFLWRGIFSSMVSGSQYVSYCPASTRRAVFGWMADLVPAAMLMEWFCPIRDQSKVFRFHATSIAAANKWMNEWLYIYLSIIDSCLNFRSVYMMLAMGTWLLTQRLTVENFLFVCAPITKMAWITCFGHTLFQRAIGCGLYVLRAFVHGDRGVRCIKWVRWYIDSVALFATAKFYSVALVLQLYVMLKLKGSPLISTRARGAKQPIYGGYSDLVGVWHCEIAIDIIFIVVVQIVVAHIVGTLLLMTKLRHATRNRVLRILQTRYFFVGWDAFVAMEALDIEPFSPTFVDNDGNEVAPTNCSCGALLRQLATSGPSGWVRLAGEVGLTSSAGDGQSSGSVLGIGELEFSLAVAEKMGIYKHAPRARSLSSAKRILQKIGATATDTYLGQAVSPLFIRVRHAVESIQVHAPAMPPRLQLNERVLHAHAESMWGSLLLVDFVHHPVRYLDDEASPHSAHVGGEVQRVQGRVRGVIVRDALSVLAIEERKPLLDGGLRLRIC